MTEETTDDAQAEWKVPEPVNQATKVQDNVTTPGVQRLTHPDGTVQEVGKPRDDTVEVDEPDDGVGAQTPGDPPPPVTDTIEVDVPLVAGEGWVDAPVDPELVQSVALPAGTAGDVHTGPSTDQEGATCVTVDGAPDDLTTVPVTLTVVVTPAGNQ